MTRPGTDVVLLDTSGSTGVETDSGTWFPAGLTERGPANVAELVQSLDQFVQMYGTRQSYSVLYDSVEAFFREGGSRCYIGRVIGPAATTGTHNLVDGIAATSLVVNAIGPGSWSANYKVAVVAATGGYAINITDTGGTILEDSGALVDQNAAVEWSQNSDYVRIVLGGAVDNPVVAAGAALSAGADDRASITDAQWLNALNLFIDDYGIGQVSAPGQTTSTRHDQLVTHAVTNQRVALLDLTDSAVQGTLTGNLPTISHNTRFAAAFAPWVIIPGIAGVSSRTIPPSALVAGLIGRNDPNFGVDAASAGKRGVSKFATGLSQSSWDDATRQALNSAGVNVIKNAAGVIKVYGWRALADPASDSNWLDFGNARLFNQISSEFDVIGENYIFENIDGQNGNTVKDFHNDLVAVCLEHFANNDLFGDTPDQAFLVDTGPAVNTLTTIANRELHANVQLRMEEFAEYIQIQVVKRQISDSIT